MATNQMMNTIAFCIAARANSVTNASEVLGMHRTSITRCIRLLEKGVGYKLVIYDKENFSLTEKGKALYARYKHLADYANRMAKTPLQLSPHLQRKTVEILVPMGAADTVLQAFEAHDLTLRDYQVRLRTYLLQGMYDDPSSLEKKLLNVDIAFLPKRMVNEGFTKAFNIVREVTYNNYLIGSSEYIAQHKVTEENYAKHIGCILEYLLYDIMQSDVFDIPSNPQLILVEEAPQQIGYIARGQGVTIAPIVYFADLLKAGKAKVLSSKNITYEYALVVRSELKQSQVSETEQVIEVLKYLIDESVAEEQMIVKEYVK